MSTLKTTNIQHPDSINPQIALTSASAVVDGPIKFNNSVDLSSASVIGLSLTGYAQLSGATFAGTIVAPAATTSLAPIRIPHGSAPSSPTNGDVWTTTGGLFARINGTTQQYVQLSGATFTGTVDGVSPSAAGSIGFRRTTISTSNPSGGSDGDVWIVYT
jgi:hypothetical protein